MRLGNHDQADPDDAMSTTSMPEAEAGMSFWRNQQSRRPHSLAVPASGVVPDTSAVGAKVSNGSFSGGYGPTPISNRPYSAYIAGVVIFTIKPENPGQAMHDLYEALRIMETEMPRRTVQFTIEKWKGMDTFNAIIEIWHANSHNDPTASTLQISPHTASDPSQSAMETMKRELLKKGYTIANI